MAITLSVDIGGSKIKATTIDENGTRTNDYIKMLTPNPATPQAVTDTIKKLVQHFNYDQISVGFPGYVRNNVVYTATNLGTTFWQGLDFADMLYKEMGKPARIANDADMLGLGVVEGTGLEMMVTLGTGFGTALYLDGKLLPHLEVAHHPIKKGMTYDEFIGEKALIEIGTKKWNKRLQFILEVLKTVFNYDTLYLGGGNAKKINFKLDDNIRVVTNLDGIDGGKKLWDQ